MVCSVFTYTLTHCPIDTSEGEYERGDSQKNSCQNHDDTFYAIGMLLMMTLLRPCSFMYCSLKHEYHVCTWVALKDSNFDMN